MTDKQKKTAINYRMRMLNPGESFSVPVDRYATVRSSKGHLEKCFGAHFIVTLTRNLHDPECEVTVYMPTDEEWVDYSRAREKAKRDRKYRSASNLLLYHWRNMKKLCEEDNIDPYDVLPKEFIRFIDEKNKENRNRLHGEH